MENKTITYKGKTIHYRTRGEGPLVVLLHGFGEDGTVWKGQYDLFPRHQLVIPDLPGTGNSEALDDMRLESLADAIKAIIDAAPSTPKGEPGASQTQPAGKLATHPEASPSEGSVAATPPLGDRRAILIGHSLGGYITLAFAEKYPESLAAFGLFHSSAFADSEEKKETRRKGIRFMKDHGAAEFLSTVTPNLYAPDSKTQHPEWIAEHLALTHNFSVNSLVSYYMAMIERPDRTQVLADSKVPVLFVMGQHDTATPMADGLKQCHLPQISYIHILDQSGHMGMIEEKDNTNQLLSAFVFNIENTA